MSQKEHSRAHRSRTYKRVRGVILILLVLGIIWGITALVRHNAAQPDPTPDPNAGQQTGTTDEKQNNQTPDPDPDPDPDPEPDPDPDPTPDPDPEIPDPEVPIVGYACYKIQVKDWVIRINDGIL